MINIKRLKKEILKLNKLIPIGNDFFWTIPEKFKGRKSFNNREMKEIIKSHFEEVE